MARYAVRTRVRILLLLAGWIALLPIAIGQERNVVYGSYPGGAIAGVKTAAFEVVSVRPNKSGDIAERVKFPPDGFTATNAVLLEIIVYAYGLHDPGLSGEVKGIAGAPSWIQSDRYDIQAKMSDADAGVFKKLNSQQQEAQMRLMLQSMLADRFKLRVHHETKQGSAYALVITKNGLRNMKRDSEDAPPKLDWTGTTRLSAKAFPIAEFAAPILAAQVGHPVLDRTGLTGKYDFTLAWSPDSGVTPGPDSGSTSSPEASGPSIFTAIQEQLRLKLVPVTVPTESIAIDHIEKPSEN